MFCVRKIALAALLAFLSAFLLGGCSYFFPLKSNGITLITVNDGKATVRDIEIDYPGGSYGIPFLDPGKSRSRWIKPLSSNSLKIHFLSATGEHQSDLMTLHAGDNGTVELHILGTGRVEIKDQRIPFDPSSTH